MFRTPYSAYMKLLDCLVDAEEHLLLHNDLTKYENADANHGYKYFGKNNGFPREPNILELDLGVFALRSVM